MRCTDPRTVGFLQDGKTLSWSPKTYSKEFATFQLPCGQCIACRLEYARQWAVRCIHEAEMFGEENCFITLTYAPENLKSDKLVYSDFQKFIKRLRKHINDHERGNRTLNETKIGVFVTGEYGEKNKRPHWHALVFNWSPKDKIPKYTNERGDQVYSSDTLSSLWPAGVAELGSVTFESAGYCARYAAKKLVHGKDDDHGYHPISKKSSSQAIGKRYVEKHYRSIFNLGFINLPEKRGQCAIPRYYEKWLKKTHPDLWRKYVTGRKNLLIQKAQEVNDRQKEKENEINRHRKPGTAPRVSQNDARKKILENKFKTLQSKLKL